MKKRARCSPANSQTSLGGTRLQAWRVPGGESVPGRLGKRRGTEYARSILSRRLDYTYPESPASTPIDWMVQVPKYDI